MTTPDRPALATLTHERSFESGRVHERRLDGERCLATGDGGVILRSRNGRDISGSFPEIVDALGAQAADGYVVDGEDVRDRPLLERKRLLGSTLRFDDPIRSVPHRVHADDDWFRDVCRRGWEGLIATQADAPYRSGRTTTWLRFRCEAGQEVVAEVAFTEWPRAGQLRHPRFLGLRRDENAAEVVRE